MNEQPLKDRIIDNIPGRFLDLSGQRFGRLTVIKFAGRFGKIPRPYWLCECDCGKIKIVSRGNLRSGGVKSCGCFRKECHITHGHKSNGQAHWLYGRWSSIITRCCNPNCTNYLNYGGRGIKVCERWRSFELFRKDMEPSYFDGAELERVNNDGDYEPTNVIWATLIQNANNKRNSVILECEGKRNTVAQWARIVGISPYTIYSRINRNNLTGREAIYGKPSHL